MSTPAKHTAFTPGPHTVVSADHLGDALPREMARVRDVVMPPYIEIGAPGAIVLAMMRNDLNIAAKAMDEGDVVQMNRSLSRLKGWRL